jgi:hypothetical protein
MCLLINEQPNESNEQITDYINELLDYIHVV